MPEFAVDMRGIVKRFPGVVANDSVDFAVERGEIHGLLGENGAGKTVLMSTLYGLYRPDAGEILINGHPQSNYGPATAIRLGIGMVHQHFMLVPRLSVAENIMLGQEPIKSGIFLDREAAIRQIQKFSNQYGLPIDPKARVDQLPVGAQQRVEIIKALYRGADTLILDEPTAVLTEQEVEHLGSALRKLKQEGKATILITHKLREAIEICDRITVLRKGRVIGTVHASETNERELAEMMVGRDVVFTVRRTEAKETPEPVLRAKEIEAEDDRGLLALKGVSFDVRKNEILGIAGVQGNGQAELAEVLTGLRPIRKGSVSLGGQDLTGKTVRDFIDAGIAHIPADRHLRGLVMNFSLRENAILGRQRIHQFAPSRFWQNQLEITNYTKRIVEEFGVKTPSVYVLAQNLSGGNQQRLIVGREFSKEPRMIIAAQPTRGLDVGGIEYVHEQLLKMRDHGAAVLLISMDLDEVMMLSDRIAVIYNGSIVAIRDPEDTDRRELGELMLSGARAQTGAEEEG
ncbi:MAG: heme ABC transporter ATP-binding protein [Candidatus Thorarchaeota archaeon]|nr:MAG: heme ABC transporter ATP-binding protein [Candidatus Thorarchaeota archaeon]